MNDDGYKILLIEVVNNRKIKTFHARVNGGHLEVAGPAGTGKTTAISALWEILDPGSDRISHGESSSDVSVVLFDKDNNRIKATRHYTPSGSTIKIVNSDAESISAKEFKEMISPLSSNPHLINQMKPKDRTELLLQSAGIPLSKIEEMDNDIAARASDIAAAMAIQKATVPGDEPEKAENVSTEDLTAKIEEINQHNGICDAASEKVKECRRSLDASQAKTSVINADIADIEEDIETLQKQLDEARDRLKRRKSDYEASKAEQDEAEQELKKAIDEESAVERIPQEKISELVAESTRINAIASKYADWVERSRKHEEASKALGEAQSAHKKALKAKKDLLDGAKFPLDGLSIDEDGNMTYNGMLVDNLGESERTLVLASLAIEDALKRKIRAIRLDGIESMSKKDYEKIRDLAESKGIQIMATRVTWDGSVEDNEITIVDGYYSDEEEQTN